MALLILGQKHDAKAVDKVSSTFAVHEKHERIFSDSDESGKNRT